MRYTDWLIERADVWTADADLPDGVRAHETPRKSIGPPACVKRYMDAAMLVDGEFERVHTVDPGALQDLTINGPRYGWNVRKVQQYFLSQQEQNYA